MRSSDALQIGANAEMENPFEKERASMQCTFGSALHTGHVGDIGFEPTTSAV